MLEHVLRRDRSIAVAGLASVVLFAWLCLLAMPHDTQPPAAWSPHHFAAMALMWIVMMIAMMLPSAAPMLLLHGTISRRQKEQGRHSASVLLFAVAYIAVWTAFALGATAAQWALAEASLLSPMMQTTSAALAGALLLAAGIYQWTPLKQSCLRQCRSPLEFLMAHWRPGRWGNFVMGLHHGAYCLGCCWLVMLLLFVGGVMSFVWIAGLAAFVLIEKTTPLGSGFGRAAGAALALWGAMVLWQALYA